MHARLALPLFALATLAVAPVRAQTMADARSCERAITGSAVDRAAMQKLYASGRTTPAGHFAAGCADVLASRWDSAAAHFDAAAKGNPSSSAAFLWIGNIAGQRARMAPLAARLKLAPMIRDAYAKAIELDGTNIDAREGLMQFQLEAPSTIGGDKAKAAEQALAIGRLVPYRGLAAEIAVATAARNQPAAERLLLRATTQFPDSVLGWANLSAMQADGQRAPDAFATVTRWQARGTNRMFALFALGRTAAVTGQQRERGEQALRQYLRGQRSPSDPPFANAHHRLGMIFERAGRKDDARVEFQAALRLSPQMRDAQFALDRLK
ncbi:MAG: tetratricopeptide repeat protein [Gemmatimonadaceae bacterium]|nr:tetratricopeptide repeat protein [Gemmatimonadaceae bacterium]